MRWLRSILRRMGETLGLVRPRPELNLLELIKLTDPEGHSAAIVEALQERNPILSDRAVSYGHGNGKGTQAPFLGIK